MGRGRLKRMDRGGLGGVRVERDEQGWMRMGKVED